ncbi:MAG: F0F1 ATP synthase subunit A [Robiginitomaculum sp.]|nr:F0F1 ATP synthase subunit A [Robiginitomaculum sp.]
MALIAMDPMDQFKVKTVASIQAGPIDISITNVVVSMWIAVGITIVLLLLATSKKAIIPGRGQSVAEITYEFIADMIRSTAGSDGLRFFPFVFTLFIFVLATNMLGMVPGFFTVTSQVAVTAVLALSVFFLVIFYGFYKNGLRFFKLFVPSGVPVVILPFIVIIELMSFFSRPLSHSLRLFANMLGGHTVLKVFAGFIVTIGGMGGLASLGAIGPFVFTIAILALEFLVAFLQAYVFAILTCIYLNDALHPGH